MRAALVFLALSAPALAQDVPQFDVERLCGAYGSGQPYRSCLYEEQGAYDLLKAIWGGLPEGAVSSCLREFGRPKVALAYTQLSACVTARAPGYARSEQPPYFQR